jgi:CheY-like chemotaxis protein
MQMPHMDGIMLAVEIRRTKTKEEFPLIMLTSMGQREGTTTQELFNNYLTKPVKPSVLFNTLFTMFAGKPAVHMQRKATTFNSQTGQKFPLHILLVEDNAINQKVAIHMLDRLGYRADIAGNGQEAVDALQRQSYDVILMDVQMPLMDGVEATSVIRETIPSGKQPFIVAMTANAMAGDRETYLANGMDDYISKPVRVEELVSTLERYRQYVQEISTHKSETKTIDVDVMPMDSAKDFPKQVSSTWPIDLKALEKMMGADASEMVNSILPIFWDETDPLVQALKEAVSVRDSIRVREISHTIKGSCASLAITTLAELARQLEVIGREGNLASVDELLPPFLAEYGRVRGALADGF